MLDFAAGMIAMGYLIAGVFFLRFWFRVRDVLFPVFAIAFWLLALNEALLTIFQIQDESKSAVFLLRRAAFILIAVAIVAKNISNRSLRHPEDRTESTRRSA
jgi:lipid-A-disaccharide synthase-like uncharacterized protein